MLFGVLCVTLVLALRSTFTGGNVLCYHISLAEKPVLFLQFDWNFLFSSLLK